MFPCKIVLAAAQIVSAASTRTDEDGVTARAPRGDRAPPHGPAGGCPRRRTGPARGARFVRAGMAKVGSFRHLAAPLGSESCSV